MQLLFRDIKRSPQVNFDQYMQNIIETCNPIHIYSGKSGRHDKREYFAAECPENKNRVLHFRNRRKLAQNVRRLAA